MKRIRAAVLLMLLLCAVGASAAEPTEEYVRVYSLIQRGELLEASNRTAEAAASYLEARKTLSRLKTSNPEWNPKVVDFRLRYLDAKIGELLPSAPLEQAGERPPVGGENPGGSAAAMDELNTEIGELRQALQALQADNRNLQAKLKEALSVRPASADPGELEKSEERNRALAKQVDLLRMQLAEAQSNAESTPDSETLKAARKSLEEQNRRADHLQAERVALASRVEALTQTVQAGQALREENALLKQQLAQLRATTTTPDVDDMESRLNQALTQLAVLRSEADILRLEKTALEQRMKGMRDRTSAPPSDAASQMAKSQARVVELERDRQQLQLQLARANQDLANLSNASVGEPNGLAQAEIDRLKARLAVYEAKKVPYSVGELALLRMSRGLESSNASKPKPPEGVGPLVAQAQRQFKQGDFQQAESTLKEILKADESNAFTLANLAATQMEEGRDAEAEVHLRKALAVAPRDPFTLATMGILKFRQKQYEDALDYLGLAAQYNPTSPVIYNYLGMALSEQGMRGPAETALRRAVQLQPGFGDAHFNLALVYVLQEPPLPELARWHYQKALQAGHERSAEMEQLLDQAATK